MLISLASNEFRVILFGDSNVGKSTLTHRYLTREFNSKVKKTYGVELKTSQVYVDNLAITLNILDFSGEPRFYPLFKMYCRGVVGGIFMFDMTDYESLIHYDEWMNRIHENLPRDLPLLIVGCKSDLVEEDLLSESEKIQELMGAGLYFQCSAKTGENVPNVFQTLAEQIYYIRKKNTISAILSDLNKGRIPLNLSKKDFR